MLVVGPFRCGTGRRRLRCCGRYFRWTVGGGQGEGLRCRRTTTGNCGNCRLVIVATSAILRLLRHWHHRIAVELQVQVVELFRLGAVDLEVRWEYLSIRSQEFYSVVCTSSTRSQTRVSWSKTVPFRQRNLMSMGSSS